MERTLVSAGVDGLRREALAEATGEVLELGFGTGLNLPAYPRSVTRLVAVDRALPTLPFVKARLREAPLPVECRITESARLPFEDGRFDCVVTTWTLCSIDPVEQVLGELRRVLRPGGLYLFLEHGLATSPKAQRLQHAIAPMTRLFGCGCRPDRPIAQLIEGAGFAIDRVRREVVPRLGRASGHLILGRALPGPC
jgi:ubiquinone/menaquinone biosynthesis C-methylase UbiE